MNTLDLIIDKYNRRAERLEKELKREKESLIEFLGERNCNLIGSYTSRIEKLEAESYAVKEVLQDLAFLRERS